jgi:predicted phosphodiesterase
MRVMVYSDLHLEFGADFSPTVNSDADMMILAGDIITFRDYTPLSLFLQEWRKPVLYVTGNHEYYTRRPMEEENQDFRLWLSNTHSNVVLLQDESVTIDGVHFFGGTMWTDFSSENHQAMAIAQQQMNDYYYMMSSPGRLLKPHDTVALHKSFASRLRAWFEKDLEGPRVVVTHHAPVINPRTQHHASPLTPAFNSLDMVAIIETYQPTLWVYGHTHECDDQRVGNTRIISNQLGYPQPGGGFECREFDPAGLSVDVEV